jgi:hypothetical protein
VSYRAYHDYDDDRDVITCITLSDTRPVARKEHTCGSSNKTIPVGLRAKRATGLPSVSQMVAPPPPVHARRRRAVAREDVPRLRVLPTLMGNRRGFAR